jgi:hypothetical protein
VKKEYAISETVAFGVMVYGQILKQWFLSNSGDNGPAIFWTRTSARVSRDHLKKNGYPKARVVRLVLKYGDLNKPQMKGKV